MTSIHQANLRIWTESFHLDLREKSAKGSQLGLGTSLSLTFSHFDFYLDGLIRLFFDSSISTLEAHRRALYSPEKGHSPSRRELLIHLKLEEGET